MSHTIIRRGTWAGGIVLVAYCGAAGATSFDLAGGDIRVNLDSTVTLGTGIRAKSPGCDTYVGTQAFGGAPSGVPTGVAPGCLDANSGVNDQGNLNYKGGQPFTTYLKGTHELLMRFPDDYKFMARVNWLKDFSATHASGYISGLQTGLSSESFPADARREIDHKVRLLDLWASKEFDIDQKPVRIRVGDQVISWGESLFLPGGINQTNSMDLMRLSQPGVQLKEVMLPAPIADVTGVVGGGVSAEAYIQQGWNPNYFPPVGSYWSTSTIGYGASSFAAATPFWAMPTAKYPRNSGQFGLAVRYKDDAVQANYGLYAMHYHDKSPVAEFINGAPQYVYLEDRSLFGASINFPLGNWAIGSELSYRPKDAIPLNPLSNFCATTNNECHIDEKKLQLHMTALLSLTPGDYGTMLKMLGNANTATLLAEAAVVKYPGLSSSYQGSSIASGGWFWGALTAQDSALTGGAVPPTGDQTSWGYNFDFSWVYDNSLIKRWQVQPEVYYFQAVHGHTPNAMALFMEGAKSANFILTFTHNPADWVIGVNYAKFWGPNVLEQPLLGRDFYGIYVARNF